VGTEWVGWSDTIAHPGARDGGGGPGHFSRVALADSGAADLPSPWQAGPIGSVPMQAQPAPRPPNPPPATNPRNLGTLKKKATDVFDVLVDYEIVADGAGGHGGAETSFKGGLTWSAPGFNKDGKGKITKFSEKFVWKGTISIQTLYAPGAHPADVSCYGRGTTPADVSARNITLGFHESCHRDDYVAYLQAHDLPDPPALSVGMSEADYRKAIKDFDEALKKYAKAMESQSFNATDEVGHRKSAWLATHACFRHTVP
jgi:hypothetical protein